MIANKFAIEFDVSTRPSMTYARQIHPRGRRRFPFWCREERGSRLSLPIACLARWTEISRPFICYVYLDVRKVLEEFVYRDLIGVIGVPWHTGKLGLRLRLLVNNVFAGNVMQVYTRGKGGEAQLHDACRESVGENIQLTINN